MEDRFSSWSWKALEKALCLTAVCWLEGRVRCWYVVGARVLLPLPLEHLPSQGEDDSYSSPAPVWGSSYGRQFSMNCFSMDSSHRLQFSMNCPRVGPSHRVPSFRNRVLQRGSPTGPQALPANLLQRGLVSPRGHKSWQEPAPVQAPHGVTASFGHPPALAWGPPWAVGRDLLHRGPPWAAGDSLPHHGLLHRLQGNLWRLEHLLPSCCTDLGVCRVVSVMYSHSFLQLQMSLLQVFFPS